MHQSLKNTIASHAIPVLLEVYTLIHMQSLLKACILPKITQPVHMQTTQRLLQKGQLNNHSEVQNFVIVPFCMYCMTFCCQFFKQLLYLTGVHNLETAK